jgi:hypothetical protein
MARLLIHVEGETEETFVNELLAPHLCGRGFQSVSPRLLGNSRIRSRRGGIKGWASVRDDILKHLKSDTQAYATTMVDYYALPQSGQRAWPGREQAGQLPFERKAETVQNALAQEIVQHMGASFSTTRFIPYVVMHEFEGLLFSDCRRFSNAIGFTEFHSKFQAIRDQFNTPEEINDSSVTAPSKRVVALVPNYQKPLMGTFAAIEIGLEGIRRECPLFNKWVYSLENLV